MDTIKCVICLDNISETDYYEHPECHQRFHPKCIDRWIQQPHSETRCPLCSTPVDKEIEHCFKHEVDTSLNEDRSNLLSLVTTAISSAIQNRPNVLLSMVSNESVLVLRLYTVVESRNPDVSQTVTPENPSEPSEASESPSEPASEPASPASEPASDPASDPAPPAPPSSPCIYDENSTDVSDSENSTDVSDSENFSEASDSE